MKDTINNLEATGEINESINEFLQFFVETLKSAKELTIEHFPQLVQELMLSELITNWTITSMLLSAMILTFFVFYFIAHREKDNDKDVHFFGKYFHYYKDEENFKIIWYILEIIFTIAFILVIINSISETIQYFYTPKAFALEVLKDLIQQ